MRFVDAVPLRLHEQPPHLSPDSLCPPAPQLLLLRKLRHLPEPVLQSSPDSLLLLLRSLPPLLPLPLSLPEPQRLGPLAFQPAAQ